jgi:hypothetical protein
MKNLSDHHQIKPLRNRLRQVMLLITPLIIWSYIFSTVAATKFWGLAFERAIKALDLSANQSWLLPVALNLFIAVIGLPQTARYVAALRRRSLLPLWEHISCAGVVAGMCLTACVAAMEGINCRSNITLAGKEALGGGEQTLFNAGQIQNGAYSNGILGISIELPPNWHAISLNSIRRAKQNGAYVVAGDDMHKLQELTASHPGVASVLCLRKYPDDHPGYNPTLSVSSYDKGLVARAGAGENLEAFANGYARISAPYHLSGGPFEIPVGSVMGYSVHVTGRFPTITVHQYVYLVEANTNYISLTASVIEDNDRAELAKAISTLRIVPK